MQGPGLGIFHTHEKPYPQYNCNQACVSALLPTSGYAFLEKIRVNIIHKL